MQQDVLRTGKRCAGAAWLALASCTAQPSGNDDLARSAQDFAALSAPCSEAARSIATPVTIIGATRTGGDAVLMLTAGDGRYICRREPDGSVAIFSGLAL